jgi:VWFA-related protein
VRVERKGEPVRGLRVEDFEVRSDGATLPIVAFEELDLSGSGAELDPAARGDAPEPAPAAGGRHFLVLFELGWTSNAHLQRAADALRTIVQGDLHASDALAIAIWGRTDAKLLHGFTTDRAVIGAGLDVIDALLDRSARRQRTALAALDRMAPRESRAALASQIGLGGALLAVDESDLRGLFSAPTGGGFGADLFDVSTLGRFEAGDGDPLGLAKAAESMSVVLALTVANRALSELVEKLSSVPGPRHALLFGQGYAGFSHMLMEFGTVYGLPPPAAELLRTYHGLTNDLTASGWVVHSFDPTGVGGGSAGMHPGHEVTSTQSAGFVPFRRGGGLTGDGSDPLFFIARRTGGDFYDNYGRLATALVRMLDRTAVAYRLVFQSSGVDVARHDVRYRVVLRGGPEGAELRGAEDYRLGQRDLDPDRDPRRLQRRLLGVEEERGLGATLRLVSMPAGADVQRVVLSVGVPLDRYAEPPRLLWIQAVSLERGKEGALDGGAAKDFWSQKVDLAAEAVPPKESMLLGDLLAPCDGARLRVRVTVDGDREELRTLEVPPCRRSGLVAIPLRGLREGIVAHEVGFEPANPSVSPIALGGRTLLPAADPVVASDGPLALLVSAAEWGGDSRLEALLLEGGERPVRSGPLAASRLEPAAGSVRFLASLPLDALARGHYRLLLRAVVGEEVRAEAPAIELEIP